MIKNRYIPHLLVFSAGAIFLIIVTAFLWYVTNSNYSHQPLKEAGFDSVGDIHAWDINGGYRFIPIVDGKITQLGVLCDSGIRPVRLYDYETGSVLATTFVKAAGIKTWSYEDIAPIDVVAGKSYVVATRSHSNNHCRNLFNLPVMSGGITIYEDLWSDGNDAMPRRIGGTMDGIPDVTFLMTGAPQSQPQNVYTEPAPNSRYLRLLHPSGKETLCLGSTFNIAWESVGISRVTLEATQDGDTFYRIGAFPADFNETGAKGSGEYPWIVGTTAYGFTLKESYGNQIRISSPEFSLRDTNAVPFFTVNCQG